MSHSMSEIFSRAVREYGNGELKHAKYLYSAILEEKPHHPDAIHNLGVIALNENNVAEALQLFKRALGINSQSVQFWLSYIDALIQDHRFNEAASCLTLAIRRKVNINQSERLRIENQIQTGQEISEKALSGDELMSSIPHNFSDIKIDNDEKLKSIENPPLKLQKKVLKLYDSNLLTKNSKELSKLLKRFPRSPFLFNLQGANYRRLGKLQLAEISYRNAIQLEPTSISFRNNLANVFQDQKKYSDAINEYRKALELDATSAEIYVNLGNAFFALKKFPKSVDCYQIAINLDKNFLPAYNRLGILFLTMGQTDKALFMFQKCLTLDQNSIDALTNIGNTLNSLGRSTEALRAFKRVLAIKPNSSAALNNVGAIFKQENKLEQAKEYFEKAIASDPNLVGAHRNLSSVTTYSAGNPQISKCLSLIKSEHTNVEDKAQLGFTLFKMFDDIGDIHRAFEFLKNGNLFRKIELKYEVKYDLRQFESARFLSRQLLKTQLQTDSSSHNVAPIFILGLPRSGSTLVEQIVSSHSTAHGAGELSTLFKLGSSLAREDGPPSESSLLKIRNDYLDLLSKKSENCQYVTDKLPHNFLLIPLICLIFPEAKIIHTERNLVATGWSIFTNYFTSSDLGFAYNLDDIATFIYEYKELMDSWNRLYGERIYSLDYERLTTDPATEIRSLAEYLHFDWEENMLFPEKNQRSVTTASQLQIRKKIYKDSSLAWKRYEPFLGDFIDKVSSNIH